MKQEIESYLKERGYNIENSDSRIITKHKIDNLEIRIAGDIPKNTNMLFSLPKLFLLDRKEYGSIAHVAWNDKNEGLICEGVTENIHLDYDSPEKIYLLALDKAVETLRSLLIDGEKNKKEVFEEFSGHWRFSVKDNHKNKVISFLALSESIQEITPIVSYDPIYKVYENITVFIENDEKNINEDYCFLERIMKKNSVKGKGIYLPLNEPILPPNPNDTIMTWWLSVFKKLPEKIREQIKKISERKKRKIFWLISSVKIKEDKYSWFCIKFENKNKALPPLTINNEIDTWCATAYNVILHNKEFVRPRGGTIKSLTRKNIAIVGCGSIGAEIARQLAATGISKLMLIDSDTLAVENIYRHYLSSKYIGMSKTSALGFDLKRQYPYLQIEKTKIKNLKNCLDEGLLNSIDGIIVATGNPTEERYFNEKILKIENRPWVIYSWTEGHGVGGHSLYVHSKGKGCLNCLYRDGYGEKSLNSIQNFLEADQDIAVDLTGCGTHFLPYSYSDAIQSALLASRLTLYAFQDQLKESCRISWKGLGSPGFNLKTTYRYKQFNNSLGIEPLYWEGCDVCNI